MRSFVQKAAVRVISSELDRRATPVEQALHDIHARLDASEAQVAAAHDAVRATRSSVSSVADAHERLVARLDELTERVRRGEDVDRAHLAALEQLRLDLSSARDGLAEITGVLERLTQAG